MTAATTSCYRHFFYFVYFRKKNYPENAFFQRETKRNTNNIS